MENFDDKLKGGDLRSIGNADKVVNEVKSQHDFDILFGCLFHPDRKVVMRAADAIEKITLTKHDFLRKHKKQILEMCGTVQHIELKWHLALLVSRLTLTKKELGVVWNLLTVWATDKKESKIVRVNSLQGLYNLLQKNRELEHDFGLIINEIHGEQIPSISARIRKFIRINNAG